MPRSITNKYIQVHYQCSCGHGEVGQVERRMRFKDLAAAGIRYKKDATTGEWFFLQRVKLDCAGKGHFYQD